MKTEVRAGQEGRIGSQEHPLKMGRTQVLSGTHP